MEDISDLNKTVQECDDRENLTEGSRAGRGGNGEYPQHLWKIWMWNGERGDQPTSGQGSAVGSLPSLFIVVMCILKWKM